MGIAFILTLFLYALLKGGEFAYFSLSVKDTEDFKTKGTKSGERVLRHLLNQDFILGTVLQIQILLQITVLFLVIELVNLFFDPVNYLFLVSITIVFISAILLKYSGCAFSHYISSNENNKKFALKISLLFSFLLFITNPFNRILSKFTHVLGESREERDAQSMEEFIEVVDATDKVEVEEKKLLKSIVGLNNTSAFQIMKPRVDIVSLDMEMTSQEVVHKAIECGFSRLPVYEKSPDNIKGFLYIKDLVVYLRENVSDFDWHKHIREAYFVPGSKKINDLLEEFRQKKMHLALVVDEYGGTDGLVTLEDILEEIVGEISDETDKTE
jgi:putative hemolysin